MAEGKTESSFVKTVLAPHFSLLGIDIRAVQVTTSANHRGGMTSFARFERQLLNLMNEHSGSEVRFTTLLDYYALPADFPGASVVDGDPFQRVRHIEQSLDDHFQSRRFIPYIQMHEFEALLFTDLGVLPPFFPGRDLRRGIDRLRYSIRKYSTPELIDDGPETSPSRRLIQELPGYRNRKADVGHAAAAAIGLERLRAACPHFSEWVGKLEALAGNEE